MSAASNEPENVKDVHQMDSPGDAIKTYSLAEVAAQHVPSEIKDPVRWLAMRFNRGELRGVRMGRYWRMRDSDVEYMLARYSNDQPAPSPSIVDGLSERSQRRIRNAL
ncbi:hypothetical protein [Mycobacterium marseillense]|uniref:hypothetical protein n=1 Tax=Mycobacterium marseillense TaxID=701042 RepID=UPI0011A40122|nr:hypothetical protein [Mycobacterium marseillense]